MGIVGRLRLIGLASCAFALLSGTAIAGHADTTISVRVVTVGTNAVRFRFSGFRQCDSVVANATVLAWLGPEVGVVVRRGTKTVARGGWEACTKPSGRYLPWEVRPRANAREWSPAGAQNTLELTAKMPAPGQYRYGYTITVDGSHLKSGRIEVAARTPSTRRIRLR